MSPVILTSYSYADHFVRRIKPSDLSSGGSLFSVRYELHPLPRLRNFDEFQSSEVAVGQPLLRLLRLSPALLFSHTCLQPSNATALIRRKMGRGLGTFKREALREKQIYAAFFKDSRLYNVPTGAAHAHHSDLRA